MLLSRRRVFDQFGNNLVSFKIERVTYDDFSRLDTLEDSHFNQVVLRWLRPIGKYKRVLMSYSLDNMKWGWHDIHFPVADHNVAITTEAFDVVVFVLVIVVSVQEGPMANDEIEHWKRVTVRLFGVTPKDVVNVPSVVKARRNLAI